MSGIVWLASYPKSGNTWLRAFLTNYLSEGAKPASINELVGGPIAGLRSSFDEIVGVESSELSADEVDALRPAVYRILAAESHETLYLKVHDAYLRTRSGEPLFPPDVTNKVLYIIRHPCDIAISYANHNGIPVEIAIKWMADVDHSLAGRENLLEIQLRQRLCSWSEHVRSWVDKSGLNVRLVRYEDMIVKPQETFGGTIGFVGLPYDAERLERAIDFSRFKVLKEQERAGNFNDRSPMSPVFFWKGQAGDWRAVLSDKQVEEIVRAHGEVMRRFEYLDENGRAI